MTGNTRTVLVAHPAAELTGAGHALLQSVTGLREARCHVVVALPEDGPLVAELHHLGAEVLIVPMMVLRRPHPATPGWTALLRSAPAGFLSAWLTLSQVRPDTVYVSTASIPQWPLLTRFRRISTVSHLHSPQPTSSRWTGRLLHRPHLASQHTLIDSRADLESLHRTLPALARRATIVYDALASPASPTPPREPLEGPLRILTMGPLCPGHGADLAIEAATLLGAAGRRAKVTLVGTACPGEEWFEEQLREQAADADVEDVEIEFDGASLERWSFFAHTDVVLVPTRHEDLGDDTAITGVLSLRPVVAGDTPRLREAVGDHRTVRLVRSDDAAEIARALDLLVEEWSEIVEELPASRAEALRRYDPAIYRAAVVRACGAEPVDRTR